MFRRLFKWKKGRLLREAISGVTMLSSLLLITACSNLNYTPTKEQNLKRYEILLLQDLKSNLVSTGPTLLIYPIQVNNTYSSTRIAYRLNAYEISYYAQNEWADTPSHMLLPLVIANMENSKLFSAVVNSGSSAITDLALDSELITLIHEYQETGSKIVMSVRLQLIDLRNRNVIASDTLTIEEVAPSNDPYGAVVATNIATGKLLESMQDFIRQSVQLE